MNPQEHGAANGLTPESAELVETYFARVHGALLVAATGECAEAVEDLRGHVYEELAATAGTTADVTRVLAELGPPEALAAACSDTAAAPLPSDRYGRSPLTGTILGMPYELRFPTAERVALRWWDPTNPDVLVPRLFGVGWDLNFAAIAVGLGLIKPDDEDVPFASVPERWLAVSAALPAAVAIVLVVLVASFQGLLPAQVAVHWGISGADRFASKGSALILPVAMTLLGLGILGVAWVRRRSPLTRVAAGALATMLCTISCAAYAQQVVTARGGGDTAVLLSLLGVGLALTFVMLVTLARIGRAAEVRRDLDNTSKKGSV